MKVSLAVYDRAFLLSSGNYNHGIFHRLETLFSPIYRFANTSEVNEFKSPTYGQSRGGSKTRTVESPDPYTEGKSSSIASVFMVDMNATIDLDSSHVQP